MKKKEMLDRFQLVYVTTNELMKCVILGYMTTPEKTKAMKDECLHFIELCKPFHLALQKEKLPANNKALLIALDILLEAKECVKNKNVFDDIARVVVQVSSDILTENIKKLAVELDKYSK
jgi:hypothetical protein